MKKCFILILISLFLVSAGYAGDEWFRVYKKGIEAIKIGEYKKAALMFQKALQVKREDKKRIRTYGMHFIEYYPHRELGIALYHLGMTERARNQLQTSMRQEPTRRAQEYLNKIKSGPAPSPPTGKKQPQISPAPGNKRRQPDISPPPPATVDPRTATVVSTSTIRKSTVERVGERMCVAVLPFENKGASRDLGEIIFDKMITALFNQERFKVIERAQLEKILEEQKLGASGILDANTAAELGKGIGVDGIVIGSVAASPSGAISLDARIIDTESATIIVAHDSYSKNSDAQSVKMAVEQLANKFVKSLPLVQGSVIRINSDGIMLDIGRKGGIKKGIKCTVYKEGSEVKHPVTGEVLGKEKTIVAEVLITDSFDKYSSGRIIKSEIGLYISVGDKFLTK